MGLLILMSLVLLLIGTLPSWEYSRRWSRWPSALLGCVLAISVLLVQLNFIPLGL